MPLSCYHYIRGSVWVSICNCYSCRLSHGCRATVPKFGHPQLSHSMVIILSHSLQVFAAIIPQKWMQNPTEAREREQQHYFTNSRILKLCYPHSPCAPSLHTRVASLCASLNQSRARQTCCDGRWSLCEPPFGAFQRDSRGDRQSKLFTVPSLIVRVYLI